MASEDDSKIGEMKTRIATDFTKGDERELRLTSSKEKEENK